MTGQCLQDDDGSVSTQPCDGLINQAWHRYGGPDEAVDAVAVFAFQNAATGLALQNDGYGNGYGNLSTQPYADRADQAWEEFEGYTGTGDQFETRRAVCAWKATRTATPMPSSAASATGSSGR